MADVLGNYYSLFKGAGAVTAALSALLLLRTIYRRKSTISNLVGPPSHSWIFGNMVDLLVADQYGDFEFQWQRLYGAVYRVKDCFGEDRLMISDPVALQSIINSTKFDHSPMFANLMKLLYEKRSLVNARGEYHRRLRAAMNPGFSAAGCRQYQSMITHAAEEITRELETASSQSIDMCPLLSTATLSIVSEAVFGCAPRELGDEFVQITTRMVVLAGSTDKGTVLWNALGNHLPGWIWDMVALLPTSTLTELRRGRYLAKQIGRRIVQEKITAAQQGPVQNNDVISRVFDPIQSDKGLTEEEMVAQTSLLVVAGQETSANTLLFGLLELARNPGFQDSLRLEIHSSNSGKGSDLAYNNMPLLNAFIKEILRLYPVITLEERVATENTVIPLLDSVTSSTGERLTQIPIRKGQVVTLSIAAHQRLESLWGEDANKFRPSRWVDGSNYQGDAIGPYANLLAFFGGPHTCIGWRLAILEMQVIICELVGKFSFALPEGDCARMHGANVIQPTLSTGEKGAPFLVERVL